METEKMSGLNELICYLYFKNQVYLKIYQTFP